MSSDTKIVTRFAPSPTGFLHIGGARTALFNWAFARHYGGQFLLRIEDTDRKRSTDEAVAAILDGMDWLGLEPDGEVIYQHKNTARHKAIAETLLASGHAYKCYCTAQELAAMREAARAANQPTRYDGRCRNRNTKPDTDFVVRFKAPQSGHIIIDDKVQGEVRFANQQMDDLILLRSDGTPTYMLSVVVDDYDMGISHIIRGDDHLTNAARQTQIYQALGWRVPIFAHIPLIHGADGAKLSKRHNALGVAAYDEMGYLPSAMCNYLARLGWSHADDEIFSIAQFVEWFGLEGIGRAPARFDIEKLNHVNAQHIRMMGDAELVDIVVAQNPALAFMDDNLLKNISKIPDLNEQFNKMVKDIDVSALRKQHEQFSKMVKDIDVSALRKQHEQFSKIPKSIDAFASRKQLEQFSKMVREIDVSALKKQHEEISKIVEFQKQFSRLQVAMPNLKPRIKKLTEVNDRVAFLLARPLQIEAKAAKTLTDETRQNLAALLPILKKLDSWAELDIKTAITDFMATNELKMGDIAPALRAALTGKTQSVGVFLNLAMLDKNEALARIREAIKFSGATTDED